MPVIDRRNVSSDEWAAVLGAQIRQLRLRAQMDQQSLANRASISTTALKKLEAGKGVNLLTLIKTVRTLGKTDWLEALAPTITVNPMQMLKSARKQPRQRAPRRIKPQLDK